jgi:hypothetical protein
LIARGTSMHRKIYSRFLRRERSAPACCLLTSRRGILPLSVLRWHYPCESSFQTEIAGVFLFPRRWCERPLRVNRDRPIQRQFRPLSAVLQKRPFKPSVRNDASAISDRCTAAKCYSMSGNSPHIHGTHVPVEEPSTASIADAATRGSCAIKVDFQLNTYAGPRGPQTRHTRFPR